MIVRNRGPRAADTRGMKPKRRPIRSVTLPLSADDRRTWTAAADREGLSLRSWLRAAAELAVARGSTR